MNKEQPILVSIDCLVYNHEPYLRQCLDGFLMQQTNFRFVAIVHDDVSTDGSAAIIREYAEKYPDIIVPIFETENQYRKNDGSLQTIMFEAHKATGAKYVAICEGDDYWTDPLKLQKQVDFLETHEEYSVCWHDCDTYDDSKKEMKHSSALQTTDTGVDITEEMYLNSRCSVLPLTMIYRLDKYDNQGFSLYRNYRDVHQIFILLKRGKGYRMSFNGGVYTLHSDSETHFRSKYDFTIVSYIIFSELYRDYPNDKILEEHYKNVLIWNYRYSVYNKDKKNFYKRFWPIVKSYPIFAIKTYLKMVIVRIKIFREHCCFKLIC